MNYRVVGVDLSPYMGRMAARRLRANGLALDLLRCRAEQLPLATAAFDTVLATFPTPYIFEPAALAAMRRVLRADGRFIIVLGAEQVGGRWAQRFVSWLFRVTGQGPISPDQEAEPQLPPPITAAFIAAGFQPAAQYVHLPTSRVLIVVSQVVE